MSSSITLVQSNKAVNTNTISFTSNNTAGNLGLAAISVNAGTIGNSPSSSNCNSWDFMGNFNTNVGNRGIWICYSLNSGAETLTFSLSLSGGGPSLFVEEWQISGATTYGVIAMQQPFDVSATPLTFESTFLCNSGTFIQNLVVLIRDVTTAHGWSCSPGTLDQETTESGGASVAIGYNQSTTFSCTITFAETSVTTGFPSTDMTGVVIWATP